MNVMTQSTIHSWDRLRDEFYKPEHWLKWSETIVHIAILLALAWLFTRMARRALGSLRSYIIRVMDKRGAGSTLEMENRASTIISVLGKLTSTGIWIIALVMALAELGQHIEPLLAGLGIAGIAVGFGAQTLIKDWLGGLFILMEDQLRIGDSVTINGIGGAVEEINLRTTVLRGETGAVFIIANGSITSLSNATREYSYFVLEVTIAHDADVDRALAIVSEEGDRIIKQDPYKNVVTGPLEMIGVDRISDRGVIIKARIKTLPTRQWDMGRELNRRVKTRMSAEGITFPAPLPPAPPKA
jgi:moderate conductance mechanosensitive channel